MPATGALIGTPPSMHRERGTAHRRHRGGAVRAEHVGDDAQRVGPLLLRRDDGQQRPLGERAVADLATASASRHGRSRRWRTAGSCSGGCSAWWCRGARRGRSNCSMRGMPSVSTLSTWVSPRWKRPEPCDVGRMLDLGRERPDVGGAAAVDAQALVDDAACARPSSAASGTRGLHLLGVVLRTGSGSSGVPHSASSSPSRISSRRSLRSVLSAIAIASRRVRRWPARRRRRTRRRRSRCGSRRGSARSGPCSRTTAAHELLLELDATPRSTLGLFEALGDHLFGDLRRALFVEAPGGLGATGLHHHDRDVAATRSATGDDELEGGLRALLERGVRDPLASRDATGAPRRSGRRTGCPTPSARPTRR